MPVEITSRISREQLLELLETEAPVQEQRITARMPVVTLSDLLCENDDRIPPPPDPDALEPSTVPRPHVRATGTDQAITALSVEPSMALALMGALEALMSDRLAAHPSRLPTERLPADEPPAVIVDVAPVDRAPRPAPRSAPLHAPRPAPLHAPLHAPRRTRRARSRSEAFDLPPLNAGEIARVLERLDEHLAAPVARDTPPVLSAAAPPVPVAVAAVESPHVPMPMPVPVPVPLAPAVGALQLTTLASPLSRLLVIAASCTLTLLVALLVTLL